MQKIFGEPCERNTVKFFLQLANASPKTDIFLNKTDSTFSIIISPYDRYYSLHNVYSQDFFLSTIKSIKKSLFSF